MNDDRLEHLAEEIRTWAARPPARPPRVARTRVMARLDERQSRPAWKLTAWKLAAAALVLTTAVIAGWLLDSGTPPEPSRVVAAAPPQKLLVYELRSGTKLYLALAAPAANP